MLNRKISKDDSFVEVGATVILFGAFVLAVGLVQWVFDYIGLYSFGYPVIKILGGAVVLTLGYILLEIDLIRRK